MELKLKVYTALCAAKEFTINGVEAEASDFGSGEDTAPIVSDDPWDSYCCGNMEFISVDSTKEVLDKYKITESEYDEVCDKLSSGLSFGSCGWCL
jgi:hypothetical protein